MTTNAARVALPLDGSRARFAAIGRLRAGCVPTFLVRSALHFWLAGKAMVVGADHRNGYAARVPMRPCEGR